MGENFNLEKGKNTSKTDEWNRRKVSNLVRKFEAKVDENLNNSKEKIQRKEI